nr:hypothetical protein [Tanacetum cinerariifolium]
MAKKDLINKSGVARSFPGSFPQRGLNGKSCLKRFDFRKDFTDLKGKGAGFELGRSGESWVSRRSGMKSEEVELQVGWKWGVYSRVAKVLKYDVLIVGYEHVVMNL